MSAEAEIEIDPLFTGMTRPPLTMGVPMEFFGLGFMLFGIGMIMFASITGKVLFFVLAVLPLHAIGYVATERDPQWMRVWLVKLAKCPPIRNRRFWLCNSYQP
jgi:type IV secretion system protein VirB3